MYVDYEPGFLDFIDDSFEKLPEHIYVDDEDAVYFYMDSHNIKDVKNKTKSALNNTNSADTQTIQLITQFQEEMEKAEKQFDTHYVMIHLF